MTQQRGPATTKSSNRRNRKRRNRRGGQQAQESVKVTQAHRQRSMHFEGQFRRPKTFHEAASPSVRKEEAVDSGPNGANGEIEILRMQSRWMHANDSTYRNACRQVANNLVGYGIKPLIHDPVLLDIWNEFVPESDARGKLDFYGQSWMLANVVPKDGESFARVVDVDPATMKSGLDFQLQLLEADHVPLDWTRPGENGTWIVSGVERDRLERVVRYWVYDFHPRDYEGAGGVSMMPSPVSPEKFIHVYMPERYSDARGYPWASSAFNIVESLRTFDEAVLERAKGQAMFGGFFKKPRLAGDEEKAPNPNAEAPEFVPLEPNAWVAMPEDWDVEMSQPAASASDYEPFRREQLATLSVAFGFTVEQITLNYKSMQNERILRVMLAEVERYIEALQWHLFIHQWCKPVWRLVVSRAYLLGLWQPEAGKNIEDYFEIEWSPPVRHYIHMLQEIDAWVKAYENGLTSRKRLVANLGEDVEAIDRENAEDKRRSTDAGLQYPAYVADAGIGHNGGPPMDDRQENARRLKS